MGLGDLSKREMGKGLVQQAERLTKYMESVDTQLREIAQAFNNNMQAAFDRLQRIEEKVEALKNEHNKD